jgi:hypothetical protein
MGRCAQVLIGVLLLSIVGIMTMAPGSTYASAA